MRTGSTEFFNISDSVLAVMRTIAAGEYHRREIEDILKVPEKQVLRAIDKLRRGGLITVVAAKDRARGGRGLRLYRCYATETGHMLLVVCDRIDRHRQDTARAPHDA